MRTLLLELSLLTAIACAPGCHAEVGVAVVVDSPPPPDRTREMPERPGFVWVRGQWLRRGGAWEWRRGYWVRARPGLTYVQGEWVRRANRWHWIEPRWQIERHGHERQRADDGDRSSGPR